MNLSLSSMVVVVVVSTLALVGCPKTEEENKERTAACADRTNGISCGGCCGTKESSFATKVCICKGEVVPAAPK